MKFKITTLIILALAVNCISLSAQNKNTEKRFVAENIAHAETQIEALIKTLPAPNPEKIQVSIPTSLNVKGKIATTHPYGWTIGFFPGSLWYLYDLTGKEIWKERAISWTEPLAYLQNWTGHHDLGFMVYCSFGNANRLNPKKEYQEIIKTSAKSLSTRFYPKAGIIKSWNSQRHWNGERVWKCPVIIDNMMNLEMLFEASKMDGDKTWEEIAITHANNTTKNHFRKDFSTFHVIDYDTINGTVKDRATCQGYSDNSTWARGQAWAIYGFTLMYRYTKDKNYLHYATGAADFFLSKLPKDKIPPYDFNVGEGGYTPDKNSNAVANKIQYKDASAASITASALFELGEITGKKQYVKEAIAILHALSSPLYRAESGTNGNFILMHSVGSLPHKSGIDSPMDYADYYYLEALKRYKNLLEKK